MNAATQKSIRRQDAKQAKNRSYQSRQTARRFASSSSGGRSSGT